MHAVAAVIVGGTLAAAAQQALITAMPAASDGLAAARASFNSAVAGPAATATVSPVVPEPAVADATSLVKAADLQQAAAKARARAVAAAPAAAPAVGVPALAPAPAAPRPAAAPAPAAVGGPVRILSGPVTSGFGGRWGTVHQGLDIAAPIGTPIHVPMGGVVISSGPASGFGMWVRVQHSDGTITVYGHINRSFVQVGQRVAAGQVIAETGNRGQSTGPHLHIGVMQNGVYVNPKPWLDAHGFLY